MIEAKVTLSQFKQLFLNSALTFELFIHLSFREPLFFAKIEGLIFPSDKLLESSSTTVSIIPAMNVLKTG